MISDEIDLGLLELLLEDGRMSFNDLAKQVGISTPTVSTRLKGLEEQGIIEGFHIRLNHDKLDQLSVISTIEPLPGKADQLIEELKEFEMIREIYSLDGLDIQVKATVPGGADIRVLLDLLNNRELVKNYTWNVIMMTHKELPRGYISSGTGLNQPCMYCKGPIHGSPVKKKIEEKTKYFCCPVCEREYLKKLEKMKRRAALS